MELTVWCGARNGRDVTNTPPPFSRPATECIFETSSASSTVIGGSMDGIRRAIIVFPEPGAPIMSMLCPPATAVSMARHDEVSSRLHRLEKIWDEYNVYDKNN